MKKKIFSILFATILLLSMCLVTAVPAAAADTDAQKAAVLAAADRLVGLQNVDGGFPWKITMTPGASATNCLGVTAMGIMEAWKLDPRATYNAALAKAYKYCVDKPPAYTWVTNKYKETTAGVDSFPDVTFLLKLANAADSDADLLGAIQSQVSGTTVNNIGALAKSRWDDRVQYLGSIVEESPNGGATGLAEYIRDARHGQNCDALIPWDLEAAVKAALALDNAYSEQDYAQQAVDIAEVIFNAIDDGVHFNSTDQTQEDYIAGLTGAIEAFEEVNLHQTMVVYLMDLLLNEQEDDGYWNYYGAIPVDMSVQSTAYAVMALFEEGSDEAVSAANAAADWLVSSQKGDGGWFSEDGAGDEYAEIDSEAAWALAVIAAGSSSIKMTAAYIPQIGISVTPTSVSFGNVVPGTPSAVQTVTVKNTGNIAETVSASIENESVLGVYTTGLSIDTLAVNVWETLLPINGQVTPELILIVPAETAPGTYTAALIFWVEAQ